jgi:hypothetical protein
MLHWNRSLALIGRRAVTAAIRESSIKLERRHLLPRRLKRTLHQRKQVHPLTHRCAAQCAFDRTLSLQRTLELCDDPDHRTTADFPYVRSRAGVPLGRCPRIHQIIRIFGFIMQRSQKVLVACNQSPVLYVWPFDENLPQHIRHELADDAYRHGDAREAPLLRRCVSPWIIRNYRRARNRG